MLSCTEHEKCLITSGPGLFSSLFYPLTLEGGWVTTEDFATIFFHLVLFTTAIFELARPIPAHF